MGKISRLGVIGAGSMGNGIGQVGAQAGYQTVLFDVSEAQLQKAKSKIEKSLEKLAQKNALKDSPQAVMGRLKFTASFQDLKECQFVVEAATENRDLKFKIFRDIDALLSPGSILATNTSSISITEIAAQTKRPEMVAGMHFMNPVPLMKLVEGIRGLATSDETFKTVREVSEQMGKTFVEAKDSPGFVVNRILIPMVNEAFFTLQEGLASAKDIDEAMKLGCNHPMGPLQLADYVGLDVVLFVAEILHRDLGDSKYRPCPLLRKYVEAGWHGVKTGRGVYVY